MSDTEMSRKACPETSSCLHFKFKFLVRAMGMCKPASGLHHITGIRAVDFKRFCPKLQSDTTLHPTQAEQTLGLL